MYFLFILVICLGGYFLLKNAELKSDMNEPVSRERNTKTESYIVDKVEKGTWSRYSVENYQAGMNILIYGHPNQSQVQQTFEHLRTIGINSLSINFPFYQSGIDSNEVTTDVNNTPTISELKEIIEAGHSLGFSMTLRPIMDEQVFLEEGKWRGQIKPLDPQAWFTSYESMLLEYADLAESTAVYAFNIGTELNSMQNQYPEMWSKLIHNIRAKYRGKLLYSFNWDSVAEITKVEFVEHLDFIGIDAYFPLNLPNGASTEQLYKEWKRQLKYIEEDLLHKNILITEVGIIPIAGIYRTPYAWSAPTGTFDPIAQANYYEATFQAWESIVQGIYWWGITIDEEPSVVDFSPLHLPAELILKKHYLKEGLELRLE